MSTGKLSPSEFLAEIQRDLNRMRGPGPGPASPPASQSNEVMDLINSIGQSPAIPSETVSTGVEDAPEVAAPDATDADATQGGNGAVEGKAADGSETPAGGRTSSQLSGLLNRVDTLLASTKPLDTAFVPQAPESLQASGLVFEDVERLVLKMLLSRGAATGRHAAQQICLPFPLVEPILKSLKNEQLIVFKSSAAMGDYEYSLTDNGRDRARRYAAESSYFGAATVTLKDYLHAMASQSIAKQNATQEDLKRAFSDLIISQRMFDRLGPAINSGRGMFLFGEPGNGKTSIAERITSCFGSTIWIPKALGLDGDIIRVYDPAIHHAVRREQSGGLLDNSNVDQRWVEITRPTIIAGGELTMEELEVRQNQATKVCESPLQLKSNCGTLVIDDFGRQRMPVADLLNRWIVPLEKRYDFLNLPSGKKVQVPFDQLIIFSTNLEPKDLVDGAFLRRIPYKIEVADPTEEEFRKLFEIIAPTQGFQMDRDALLALDYLIARHYRGKKRPFRACQPRDLLLQVRNYCNYKQMPLKITQAALDTACENYFSVM